MPTVDAANFASSHLELVVVLQPAQTLDVGNLAWHLEVVAMLRFHRH